MQIHIFFSNVVVTPSRIPGEQQQIVCYTKMITEATPIGFASKSLKTKMAFEFLILLKADLSQLLERCCRPATECVRCNHMHLVYLCSNL